MNIYFKPFKFFYCSVFLCWMLPLSALAENDPFTSAGNGIERILFGTLGTSLCGIIIGATFLMAKVGKISWERFISVGLCTAGFLGAPSIVYMIKSWVGH
jgi:type IV secretory pathway VirB2 component (pilin)